MIFKEKVERKKEKGNFESKDLSRQIQ